MVKLRKGLAILRGLFLCYHRMKKQRIVMLTLFMRLFLIIDEFRSFHHNSMLYQETTSEIESRIKLINHANAYTVTSLHRSRYFIFNLVLYRIFTNKSLHQSV